MQQLDEIKRIDIKEFRKFGYLQELNRRFLHPLGLALEVTVNEADGKEYISGVWDFRDDPEGICFERINQDKIDRIEKELVDRRPAREEGLGYWLQEK